MTEAQLQPSMLPMSPRVGRIFEDAQRLAIRDDCPFIDTLHLFDALVADERGHRLIYEPLYTQKEAARFLSTNPARIARLCNRGELEYVQIGKRRRFLRIQLERCISDNSHWYGIRQSLADEILATYDPAEEQALDDADAA